MQAFITKRRLNLRHKLLAISVLSWLVFAPAHANQMNLSNNKSSTNSNYWNKVSTENTRASRIMNNDHDHEEDTDLGIDIRRLPHTTPNNRTGSLSGLIDTVRNKVSGTQDVTPDKLLSLNASAALVMDSHTGEVLYGKNIDATRPIASISKLMTSIVILDARLPMDEMIKEFFREHA